MYDVKLNRIFLKKVEIPSISLDDFFQGAQVTILSRVLRVTDYGDVHTRKKFEVDRSRTFAMIKPDGYKNMGKILIASLRQASKSTMRRCRDSTRLQALSSIRNMKESLSSPICKLI